MWRLFSCQDRSQVQLRPCTLLQGLSSPSRSSTAARAPTRWRVLAGARDNEDRIACMDKQQMTAILTAFPHSTNIPTSPHRYNGSHPNIPTSPHCNTNVAVWHGNVRQQLNEHLLSKNNPNHVPTLKRTCRQRLSLNICLLHSSPSKVCRQALPFNATPHLWLNLNCLHSWYAYRCARYMHALTNK